MYYRSESNIQKTNNKTLLLPIVVIVIFCITIFVPKIRIWQISFGLDDIIVFIFFPGIVSQIILFSHVWKLKRISLFYFYIWLFIIFTGILSGLFGSLFYLNQFILPTEMWQYVKRMVFFFTAFYFSMTERVSSKQFYNILLFTIFFALLIGCFQIVPNYIGEKLSSIYARTDVHLEHLVERSLFSRRNYGVAGMATSWGGFSMFASAVTLSGLVQFGRSNKILKTLILVIAIVNIIFSGSRIAIISFLTIYLFYLVAGFRFRKNGLLFVIMNILGFGVIILPTIYLLLDKINFILFRFNTLVESRGGGRIEQAQQSFNLIKGFYSFLFGVGNTTQRTLAVSYGAEIEPIYLIVNYGLIGIFLRYGLIFLIFIYSYRLSKITSGDDKTLAIAAILSLIGYMIFSLGYFFFQEIYVGLLPWLLFGWVIGRSKTGTLMIQNIKNKK